MKTFKNEPSRIKQDGEMQDYLGLIRLCLDQMPPNGFTFDDLRERSRIEKYLESDNGSIESIELEDADAANLKAIVQQMRWGGRHPDLLAFCDAIEAL